LRQRLSTAISKGKSAAVILELQEKLRDAEADLAKEQEYDDSKRELNTLSKIAVVTGIGIGASVIFFVLMRALK
jgi:acid phosphatase family membrane protein YuiD